MNIIERVVNDEHQIPELKVMWKIIIHWVKRIEIFKLNSCAD
jgi:hypothetical protein